MTQADFLKNITGDKIGYHQLLRSFLDRVRCWVLVSFR